MAVYLTISKKSLQQFIAKITSTKSSVVVILFALLLSIGQVFAQEGTFMSGRITDQETGSPLVGASVSISSLRIGAVTDKDGYFRFRAPSGRYTLEVRYVGYQTYTQSIVIKENQTTTVEIKLTQGTILTNEIVVVGLSGEVDRTKLGNTIGSVGSEAVNNVVSSSAIDALSGRVLGAQVTKNSGTPGAGTYITLRGRKTIEGSSEPLYVVDGIIIDNTSLYEQSGHYQFSNRAVDINPDDIESMQILKGASAAAIYGAKAGNGVIIINTKRGKLTSSDKPARVNFYTSFESGTKAGTVPLQRIYGQRIPAAPYTPGSSDSYAMDDNGLPMPLPAGTPTYDHSEDVFRTAYSTENNLSISGGVPQFDYLLSGSYLYNQGYVEGSSLERSSIRANLGFTLFPKVTVQSNTNYIYTDNKLPQDGSNTSGIMLGGLRTPPDFNNKIYLEDDGVTQHRFASYDNPIWTQKTNIFDQKINRVLHNTEAKWMPFDWLTLSGRYGMDWYSFSYNERFAVQSANSPSRLGSVSRYDASNWQQNLDLTFNINQSLFEDNLAMNLVGGSQIVWYDRTTTYGYSSSTLPFFDQITAGATKDASSSLTKTKTVGYFGQLTSTYLNRYSLTLGLRRDGSSTFGESNKFHYYPKVGLSYTLSNEPFFEDMKNIISNVRLRGSWGEAGSPTLPYAYATNTVYLTDGNFDPWVDASQSRRGGFNGIRAYEIAGAKDINPELSIEREVGIDLGLLNDRVTIEATFYHSNVFDMILSVPAPPSTGFTYQLKNGAAMWNEGIELGITANPIRTKTVNWVTALNYTRNYNLVTSLDAQYYDITGGFVGALNDAVVGYPLGSFRMYGWLRFDADRYAKEDTNYVKDAEMNTYHYKDGDIRYSYWDPSTKKVVGDDYEGNYVGAPRQSPSLVMVGDPNPSFMLSWRNDITLFNNLTISFLFDGVFNFDVWNGTRGALYNFGVADDTKDRADLWVENGHQVYDYTNVIKNDNEQERVAVNKQDKYRAYYNGFNINEPFIEDGTFIKLRELSVSYRWRGLEQWNLGDIVFSFAARNLFTITDYTGFDPEVNTFSLAEGRGIDFFTLPQMRSYRFGISINY
ncbi:MAG: SusC/RagA family TonB-linked outer membrane protein [Chloroherpetonaceae bacterium]